MPLSLIIYSIRRLTTRPLSFASSAILTAISTVALLAIVNSYQAQLESLESSSQLITVETRVPSFDLQNLKPLLNKISEIAELTYLSNKLEIKAISEDAAHSISQTLRSALDSKNFKISLQADNNQQTKELLNALSANLFIVIILVSVVSGLIIAASTELSFLESSSDLKALRLLSVKTYQVLLLLMLQIIIPAATGTMLALIIYASNQNYFNQYILDSLIQVSAINQTDNKTFNINQYLLSFAYGILISGLACCFAVRHAFRIDQSTIRLNSFRSNQFKLAVTATLSLCLFVPCLFLTVSSKLYAYSLVIVVLIFIACLTSLLSSTINQFLRNSFFAPVRTAASYLKHSRSWTYLPYLAIALAFNILVALNSLLLSFEQSFTNWLSNSLDKQIYVRQAALNDPTNSEMLPESTLKQLFSNPALSESAYLSSSVERFNYSNILVSGSSNNLEQLSRRYNFLFDHSLTSEFNNGDALIINEIFSNRFKLKSGDSLTLLGKNRKVIAVYRDYGSQLPTIMLPFEVLKSEFGVSGIANISFNIRTGFEHEPVYQELKDSLISKPQVYNRDFLIQDALQIFYQTFNITIVIGNLLLGLIAVAIFIFLTLCLIQDFNSLRILQILGKSPAFYFKYCLAFGFLLCLPAIVLAPVSGTALAYILVKIINPVIFGWSLDFYFSASYYAISTLIMLLIIFCCACTGYAVCRKKILSNTALYE